MEQVVPLIAATGWASGISAYATLALLSISGQADLLEVPATLERTDVLVVALILFAVEFVADKIPLVDSLWDVGQTAARPFVGGAIGALIAGDDGAGTLVQVAAGGGSGLIALTAHGAKATIRLAVNSSPEPFSNIIVSLAEDGAVAGVVLLATAHPWWAAGFAGVFLALAVTAAVLLAKAARKGWQRFRERRSAPPPDGVRPSPP